MLFKSAIEALPDIGLVSISDKISIGKFINLNNHVNPHSIAPLFIKMFTLKIIANKLGNKLLPNKKASLLPSTNDSYKSIFFTKPYTTIIKTIKGNNKLEILKPPR